MEKALPTDHEANEGTQRRESMPLSPPYHLKDRGQDSCTKKKKKLHVSYFDTRPAVMSCLDLSKYLHYRSKCGIIQIFLMFFEKSLTLTSAAFI